MIVAPDTSSTRPVAGLEVLDHHLLLAEQLVDQQRDTPAFGLDDDHDRADPLEVETRHVEDPLEFEHRHVLVAHLHEAAGAADRADHPVLQLKGFDHRGQRQDVALLPDPHAHAVHDRQRQRQAHLDAHAVTFGGVDLERAAQAGDVLLHHVRADTAAADIGLRTPRRSH